MAGERGGGIRTPVMIGAGIVALVIGLALGVLLVPDGDAPPLETTPEPSTTTPSAPTESAAATATAAGCTEAVSYTHLTLPTKRIV